MRKLIALLGLLTLLAAPSVEAQEGSPILESRGLSLSLVPTGAAANVWGSVLDVSSFSTLQVTVVTSGCGGVNGVVSVSGGPTSATVNTSSALDLPNSYRTIVGNGRTIYEIPNVPPFVRVYAGFQATTCTFTIYGVLNAFPTTMTAQGPYVAGGLAPDTLYPVIVGGTDGTYIRGLSVDATGKVNITGSVSATVSGSVTVASGNVGVSGNVGITGPDYPDGGATAITTAQSGAIRAVHVGEMVQTACTEIACYNGTPDAGYPCPDGGTGCSSSLALVANQHYRISVVDSCSTGAVTRLVNAGASPVTFGAAAGSLCFGGTCGNAEDMAFFPRTADGGAEDPAGTLAPQLFCVSSANPSGAGCILDLVACKMPSNTNGK